MTATPEMIPSDLTLEITENLSPERFLIAARSFFGYIVEIGSHLAQESEKLKWFVTVKEGSSLLAINPLPSIPPKLLQAVYHNAKAGIEKVVNGNITESGLTDSALKHLKTLSELANELSSKSNFIRLWVKRKPLEVNEQIAEIINEDWRTNYTDYGTIEGKLLAISDKDGGLQVQIQDHLFHQNVRCYVEEKLLEQVFHSFRRRVEVWGEINYRRNGKPISIKATKIEAFPDDEELPSIDEVVGIFKRGA